jgi:hypothetical protein
MGMPGCGKKKGSHGMLSVTRDLVVAMLVVAELTRGTGQMSEAGEEQRGRGKLGAACDWAVAGLAQAERVRESGRGRARG